MLFRSGWAGPNGQSIYAFILILPTGKEYIHSLKDFSLYSHTADFISKEILKVIEDVGCNKFSSVVSDNASTMIVAKKLVNEKYPHTVLVMGQDNVHGRDVQDCPVHGHELCNVQDMSRTFYI